MGKFIETSEIWLRLLKKLICGVKDYYMKPLVLKNADGKSIGLINDGDSVVFAVKEANGKFSLQIALLSRVHLF